MDPKAPKTLIDVLKHLYKLADKFPYSQLALCLDEKNLFDLMRVFGGKSIYIPTTQEFITLIQFCIVEEIGDYKTALSTNREVLNGFSEAKYNRIADQVYNRIKPEPKRKRNSGRKAKKGNKKSRKGEGEGTQESGEPEQSDRDKISEGG